MPVLDVLLCADAPPAQRDGPPDWPVLCVEVGDTVPPPAPPWIRMSQHDLDLYVAAREESYRAWAEAQVVPEPVPPEVTNFQARAALMSAGLFDAVNTALQALGGQAWQAWEYANTITRNGALVNGMAGTLGLTDGQLDDLFRAAVVIEA